MNKTMTISLCSIDGVKDLVKINKGILLKIK